MISPIHFVPGVMLVIALAYMHIGVMEHIRPKTTEEWNRRGEWMFGTGLAAVVWALVAILLIGAQG